MPLKIHVFTSGLAETNAYLVTDATLGEAVLVDAPENVWAQVGPALAKEGCTLRELWLTHGHWDHIQGVKDVIDATGARVSAHADDRILLETPGVMEVFLPSRIRLNPVKVDRWVAQGELIEALGRKWEVRHVPGHCPGSVLFWCAEARLAFSGDVILGGATGRTDFPNCGLAQLKASIRAQVYTLPDETTLFPGHYERSTVGWEKAHNEVVRA